MTKKGIYRQIKKLGRRQKELEAQRAELSQIGPRALDEEFVLRHYNRVDTEIKQIQGEIMALEKITGDVL